MGELARTTRGSSKRAPLEATAFADSVRPHMPAMIRLAARIAPRSGPDDVVQDALIRAWRHRTRYDSRRGSFSNWLIAIVANEARRAASRQRLPINVAPPMHSLSADDQIDIEDALRRLAPRQRLAVDCYYFAGLSVSETAAVMECAEGTVKSTLSDARTRLRLELQERK